MKTTLCSIAIALFVIFSYPVFAQVGINTTNPSPSSILDIAADDRGVLFPRIALSGPSDTTTIENPVDGLFIYNTTTSASLTPGFYYWNNGQWTSLSGGSSSASEGWGLYGNNGTDGGTTNYLGTSDNQALVFKTNGVSRVRISTRGQIETLNTSSSVFLGEGAGAQSYFAGATANIFIGTNADYDAAGATHSIVLGHNARTSSDYSISIGDNSDADRSNSISIGRNTQSQGLYGIVIGDGANTNSANTISLGKNAQAQGTNGIVIGESAYTNAQFAISLGKGANSQGLSSIAIGESANTNSQNAISLGKGAQAHSSNAIAIGSNTYVSQSNSIAIGLNAQAQATNSVALGHGAYVSTSNTIRLGNGSITSIQGQVPFSNPSDARFKYEVTENIPGLAFITALKPVQYKFDREKYSVHTQQTEVSKNTNKMETGFLAQDVEKVAQKLNYEFDGVHAPESATDTYSISYSTFVVPLVKAVQEQQLQIEAQQKEIDELKVMVKQLLTKK